MRKLLSILLCALGFVYTGRAVLDVEWIDENTIRVWGTGDGGSQTVVTNWLGCCTNCTLITPAELTAGMQEITNKCEDIIIFSANIVSNALDLETLTLTEQNDIATFRRFGSTVSSATPSVDLGYSFTNYIQTTDNTQAILDRNYLGNGAIGVIAVRRAALAYNDGIYDYAKNRILPYLQTVYDTIQLIISDASDSSYTASQVKGIASRYIDLSQCPCGDDGGGGGGGVGGCSCAWTAEQIMELLGYVDHIDKDQHKRFAQLAAMSNSVVNIDLRMDSYAKLVSGVLYNDATIVVDDGENSWSNVYNTGHSQLYDYDKSNILQRIELLLYSLVPNTSTNWGSATSDVSSDVDDMHDTIDNVKAYVSDANTEYTSEVNTISQKVTALFNALNFFGSGSLGNFAYGEPMQFDVYDFQFDFTNAADFRPLQQVCRTALQIFYWTAGVVFMLVFWYRVVKFTTDFALRIIHFFNNLLT